MAGLGRLSAGAKMAMKPFVKRVFTIFATNALLRGAKAQKLSGPSHGTRTCIKRKKITMVIFFIFVQKNVSRIRFQEIKIKPFHGRILISWNLILDKFFCTKIKKFTMDHFFSLDACSRPMWGEGIYQSRWVFRNVPNGL